MEPRSLIVGAFVALALATTAIAKPDRPGREPDYARLQTELKLTDAQLKAFKAQHEQHRDAMRAHLEQTRAAGEKLREGHQAAVAGILTPEQLKQLESHRREWREDMREAREECREEMREAMDERRDKRGKH
jgi:hypothetical protein